MTMAVAIVLGTIALAVGPGDTAADADVTSMGSENQPYDRSYWNVHCHPWNDCV